MYGAVGEHPLLLLAVITALNVVVVALLYLLLRRVVGPSSALLVCLVWLVLPNHIALAAWGATAQALVALALLFGGLLLLSTGRWVVPAIALAVAGITYELTIPIGLLGVALLPSTPPLPWVDRAKVAGAVGLAAVWVALHPIYETSLVPPAYRLVWQAHLGTGVFGWSEAVQAVPLELVASLLVCLALVAFWRGDRDVRRGPGLVVLGLVVLLVGVLHLVTDATRPVPYGMGDRLYAISSIGGAMVLVGVVQLVWSRSRPTAVVASTAGVLLATAALVTGLSGWSRAGHEAADHLAGLVALAERPPPIEDQPVDGPAVGVHQGVIPLDVIAARWGLRAVDPDAARQVRLVAPGSEAPEPAPREVVVQWRDPG